MKPFLQIKMYEQPIAMERPRLGKGHTYNPQSKLKEAHGWTFKEAMMSAHKNCTDRPLIVQMVFTFMRVKSNKKKYHTSTPDIDNVCKYYLDAMEGDGGIVYFNDKQVTKLILEKTYDIVPSVEIIIFER